MQKFLLHIGISLLLVLPTAYVIFIQADGGIDPFYGRLITPKQHSLIVGTSRSAQALQPQHMDSILDGVSLYNYSFTVGHSPFGPVYLESIKQKLKTDRDDGIFIVVVDPWSVSASKKHPEDYSKFIEQKDFLATLSTVNTYPNVPYLVKHFPKKNIHLFDYKKGPYFVHPNGWLEVTTLMSEKKIDKRMENMFERYTARSKRTTLSQVRLQYLKKTISFLKTYGEVYMVRLPVSDPMIAIEKSFMPTFDVLMNDISKELEVPYLSMLNDNNEVVFLDGHHIYKTSGAAVSKNIAQWISTYNK